MKTSELTGAALEWAVDMALGNIRPDWGLYAGQQGRVKDYSTDWSHGGPVIEDENISICLLYGSIWGATTYRVHSIFTNESEAYYQGTGPTPLIAAMRCIASKIGDEIELPEELT